VKGRETPIPLLQGNQLMKKNVKNLIETEGDTDENQHEHDKSIWTVTGNE